MANIIGTNNFVQKTNQESDNRGIKEGNTKQLKNRLAGLVMAVPENLEKPKPLPKARPLPSAYTNQVSLNTLSSPPSDLPPRLEEYNLEALSHQRATQMALMAELCEGSAPGDINALYQKNQEQDFTQSQEFGNPEIICEAASQGYVFNVEMGCYIRGEHVKTEADFQEELKNQKALENESDELPSAEESALLFLVIRGYKYLEDSSIYMNDESGDIIFKNQFEDIRKLYELKKVCELREEVFNEAVNQILNPA